jgi:hypothetical protein
MSSAIRRETDSGMKVNAIPGLPQSVRLQPGIRVHIRPGIAFGIIPERRSPCVQNPVHLAPEYASHILRANAR